MGSESIIPVILCGGTGSRLWPLSRKSYPKQYLSIIKDSKKSLLQNTQERLKGINNLSNPIIICNEEHRFITAEQLREIKIKPYEIFLEPIGRNTAPAVAVACLEAAKENKDPYLLVLSADHVIKNSDQFKATIKEGIKYASKGRIVTFGVIPNSPETGFGYIEASNEFVKDKIEGLPIKRFIEKPTKKIAEKLINDRRFLWNSGIFLFKTSVLLEEIKKFNPDIIDCCSSSLENSINDLDFRRLEKESFQKCPNISIDIAVMEKTNLGTVLPLDVGWNDIGSWKALWKFEERDKNGNVILGKVETNNTYNSYLRSEERLVVAIGIKDTILVETNDAILLANNKYDQHLKKVVDQLDKNGYKEGKIHKKVYRPWGNFISLASGKTWKLKRIEVNQGASLSMQLHKFRSEHWVVVKGKATVQINNKKSILKENQSIFVPLGSKHRLSNFSSEKLVIIEVQSGSYLGEDDIKRFKDEYGRK